MANEIVPGTVTSFDRQTWMGTVWGATYQGTQFLDTIEEYPGRVLDTGNVRKYARASASTLAQTDPGTSLTNSNIGGTPITLSPTGRYIQVAWSANEKAQIDFDLGNGGAAEIERGMVEAHDTAVLANIQSGTNIMSQATIDASMWRRAVGRLMGNTNGQFAVGADAGETMIRGIFSHTAYPDIMAIEEFTHADMRGDSEDPLVKGIFTKGGGVNVRFSTVVAQDGNGWHNAIYVRSAFIIGWNQRTTAFEEQTELLHRINTFSNFASNVLHDGRFIAIRLTASGL